MAGSQAREGAEPLDREDARAVGDDGDGVLTWAARVPSAVRMVQPSRSWR
jgi:hypothetical protein